MVHTKRTYTPTDIMCNNHDMRYNNITTYNKINMIRSISGVVCIGIGLITTPVPMTTAPLIMLGSYLLGYDSKVWLPKLYFKLKEVYNWFYCNRTPKRMIKSIKRRVLVW